MRWIPLVLLLGACTAECPVTPAALPRAVATVDSLAQARDAIRLYGIAKGIAGVAAIASPELAPSLNADIAVTDPLVLRLKDALKNPKANATAIDYLTAIIQAQTNTLTLRSASAVEVVPAKE